MRYAVAPGAPDMHGPPVITPLVASWPTAPSIIVEPSVAASPAASVWLASPAEVSSPPPLASALWRDGAPHAAQTTHRHAMPRIRGGLLSHYDSAVWNALESPLPRE